MATAPQHRTEYSYAEYLELEARSEVKHEYFGGQIYAMAGGTPEHAALQAAVIVALGAQLAVSPCRVHTSGLRVRVRATGLATYPDVTVVCGRSQRDPEDATAVCNPTVLVEVTSNGTESYDRGDKREHYARLESLRAYVVLSHREERVDLWTREGDAWAHSVARGGESVALACLGCRLEVSALYEAAAEPPA